MNEIEQLSKKFARLARIPWHEIVGIYPCDEDGSRFTCFCGVELSERSIESHIKELNPDFTDAREVLAVMEKHPQGKLFFASLIYKENYEAIDDDGNIPRHYVTDHTGLMLKAVVEWMEVRRDESQKA